LSCTHTHINFCQAISSTWLGTVSKLRTVSCIAVTLAVPMHSCVNMLRLDYWLKCSISAALKADQ
jgi:hypothetical protein